MSHFDRQQTEVIIARMVTALIIAHEATPGFAKRLETYRDAGLPLGIIGLEMDRRAVMASIRFRLNEN
jgi:hypothetical protein